MNIILMETRNCLFILKCQCIVIFTYKSKTRNSGWMTYKSSLLCLAKSFGKKNNK